MRARRNLRGVHQHICKGRNQGPKRLSDLPRVTIQFIICLDQVFFSIIFYLILNNILKCTCLVVPNFHILNLFGTHLYSNAPRKSGGKWCRCPTGEGENQWVHTLTGCMWNTGFNQAQLQDAKKRTGYLAREPGRPKLVCVEDLFR